MGNKALKICLLGLGRAGHFHIQSIRSIPELEISCIVDPDKDKLTDVAQKLNCHGYESINAISEFTTIDAAIVASPTHEHFSQIMKFLDLGIPVFTEKPLGYSHDEIDSCFNKARENKTPLFVGFNRRFDPSFSSLAEQVHGGVVGTPQMIRVTSRDSPLPTLEYIKLSHGIFHDCIVHDFDMLRFITQMDPVEIYATGSNFVPGIEALNDFDNVLVTLKYETGLIASIDVNRFAAYGYDQRIEVFGKQGMIQAENRSPKSTVLANASGLSRPVIEHSFPTRYKEAYRIELESFYKTIMNKTNSPITHHDVTMSHKLCELGEKACRENQVLRII